MPHVSGIVLYLSSSDWHTPLKTRSSSFLPVVAWIRMPSTFQPEPHSTIYIAIRVTFARCSSLHGCLGCFCLWAVVNSPAVDTICKYAFETLLSVLWGINQWSWNSNTDLSASNAHSLPMMPHSLEWNYAAANWIHGIFAYILFHTNQMAFICPVTIPCLKYKLAYYTKKKIQTPGPFMTQPTNLSKFIFKQLPYFSDAGCFCS